MRQLFICTSDAVLAATGNPQDLTNVAAGTIGMWQNDNDSAWLSTAPASDFSIAYGRPNSQAVVIPIDFASARVTTSTPQSGVKFKAEITIPEPVAGKDYTLQLIKLGTEKHERYSWAVTDNGSHKTTAAKMAKSLGDQFTNMIEAGNQELDGLKVNEIRLSYIGKPGIVKFNEDIGGEDVDCELPESMHVDIVKHAVDLYRTALNGGIVGAQGAQQQQQRENVRNNARDEGYEPTTR